jgi:hypothetical protein
VDLRLAKDFALMHHVVLNVSLDAFNITNQHTVLDRNTLLDYATSTKDPVALSPSLYNHISTLQSPRVLRLGARLKF